MHINYMLKLLPPMILAVVFFVIGEKILGILVLVFCSIYLVRVKRKERVRKMQDYLPDLQFPDQDRDKTGAP
jgi:hypothetical protein